MARGHAGVEDERKLTESPKFRHYPGPILGHTEYSDDSQVVHSECDEVVPAGGDYYSIILTSKCWRDK